VPVHTFGVSIVQISPEGQPVAIGPPLGYECHARVVGRKQSVQQYSVHACPESAVSDDATDSVGDRDSVPFASSSVLSARQIASGAEELSNSSVAHPAALAAMAMAHSAAFIELLVVVFIQTSIS
jgi:hypothetical protein